MEFFTVACLRRGKVLLDGRYLGENKSGGSLRVFECAPGRHDISLECRIGGKCTEMKQRVLIAGTTAFVPMAIRFFCGLEN